jgi:SET domain-containing protein
LHSLLLLTGRNKIIHKLDENGRRIFEANRDIEEGEECCISYFDLTEFSDTQARQEEMKRSWNFMCNCQRCTDEGDYEMPHFLKEMDF